MNDGPDLSPLHNEAMTIPNASHAAIEAASTLRPIAMIRIDERAYRGCWESSPIRPATMMISAFAPVLGPDCSSSAAVIA